MVAFVLEKVGGCQETNAGGAAEADGEQTSNLKALRPLHPHNFRQNNGSAQLVTTDNMSSQIASKVSNHAVASPPCAPVPMGSCDQWPH